MDRPALTLCLLVFALTFPGRDRFREPLLGAAVDIASSWVVLLAILALCAYATRSFHYFENDVLLAWAVITPILQWLATWLGRTHLRRRAARPESRRTAVIVGASALGVKVARALQGGDSARRRSSSASSTTAATAGSTTRRAVAGARHAVRGRRLHDRARRARGLHHPAARLAAAHRRAARAAAGHDGVALLRARRVRHQHHPGPAAGHERRAGGRHLRDAVHRHQRAGQADQRPGDRQHHRRPDLAAAAGHRDRRQAQLARPGALQAAPQRPRRRTRSSSTSSAR